MPIDRDGLGGGGRERRPYLTPDVVEGSPDVLMPTIMHAELYRGGRMCCLEFRDYPGYVLFCRGEDLLAVADQLGSDEPRDWAHRRVELEKVERLDTRDGSTVVKYVPTPKREPEPERVRAPRGSGPRRRLRERKSGGDR